MSAERRSRIRHPLTVPVELGSRTGTTRDISSGGVYLEIGDSLEAGSRISFTIHLGDEGAPLLLSCEGVVLRTERQEANIGIAATIDSFSMHVPDIDGATGTDPFGLDASGRRRTGGRSEYSIFSNRTGPQRPTNGDRQ